MNDIHNKFFSLFSLRATISHSWKYFCGEVQRVWHPETVREALVLNNSAIVAFLPRAGSHSCLHFLAVAGCRSHLVQYGRSLALSVLLSWLVFSLSCV